MGHGLADRQRYGCGGCIYPVAQPALARLWTRCRSCFWRLGGAVLSRIPHVPLGFDELPIIRRIEVEQSAPRGKVLDERLADGVGGARRQSGHDKSASDRADDRNRLEYACGSDAARRRDHGSRETRNQSLAPVL